MTEMHDNFSNIVHFLREKPHYFLLPYCIVVIKDHFLRSKSEWLIWEVFFAYCQKSNRAWRIHQKTFFSYEWSCCQMQNQWWIWIHFDHCNIPNRNNTNHPSWLDSKPLTRETIRNHFLDPKMKSLNIIITKTDSYCFLKKVLRDPTSAVLENW